MTGEIPGVLQCDGVAVGWRGREMSFGFELGDDGRYFSDLIFEFVDIRVCLS